MNIWGVRDNFDDTKSSSSEIWKAKQKLWLMDGKYTYRYISYMVLAFSSEQPITVQAVFAKTLTIKQ